MAEIEPAPQPAPADMKPAPADAAVQGGPVPTGVELVSAPDGGAAQGGAAWCSSAAERATSRRWLRDLFAVSGLAFMLDRPFSAMRAEAIKLSRYLIVLILGLVIFAGIMFLKGIEEGLPFVGQTDKITHHVNTWHEVIVDSAVISVAVALIAALFLISRPTYTTLLEWSKVGNTLAVMLGFVLLSFFSSDSWHAAGALSWQRFIILLVVFALCALPVLYRQSHHVVKDALKTPIRTGGIAQSVKDPLVKKMVAHMAELTEAPEMPQRALVNLRLTAAFLLGRRVLISGVIVAAAVFVLGAIVIGKQESLSLMNATAGSTAALGFTRSFGSGGYQVFLSEPLLKVSLLLGGIAAAYFLFAKPDVNKNQDLLVPKFIRMMTVLWACYQDLADGTSRIEAPKNIPAVPRK